VVNLVFNFELRIAIYSIIMFIIIIIFNIIRLIWLFIASYDVFSAKF